MQYPDARRLDHVDELHGVAIPDPYRWLEDTDAPETRIWIEAQNATSDAWLTDVRPRAAIRARLEEVFNHPRHGAPWRRGDRWFQMRNDGLQDQDVLWTASTDQRDWQVLVDPNTLSPDGTVTLAATAVSKDGRLLAYATSAAGSDWMTWQVREVETGQDRSDRVPWSKFSGATWLPDGSGFLYGAYDPPEDGAAYEAENKNQRLMLHRLGTSTEEDEIVLARPQEPELGFDPTVTHDGRFVAIHVWKGTERENRVWLLPLSPTGELEPGTEPIRLLDEDDALYELAGSVGDTFYLLTDRGTPRGRVIAIRLGEPDPAHWSEIVPEGDDTIERVRVVGGHLVVLRLHDARHRVDVLELDGAHVREIELPGIVTVEAITGEEDDEVIHLTAETFTSPKAVLAHDVRAGTTREVHPPGLDVDRDRFVTEQVFVDSTGGARIPVFLVRRRDVTPDGDAPTLLYGYGGFNIPMTPSFKVEWLVWLELGGLLAIACLRGGGEYGKEWHDAGRLHNKQNVFDDAIACAEWLAGESGWSRPQRIAIHGRSNGGLLVGACLTQRPDAFGACVAEVGVLDMLRFHTFTIGWGWVSDYGSPDDAEAFETLHAYSPYHNIVEGVCYPPTLITTGDHDDRVVPGHSFKFGAALQYAQGCEQPVLVRVDTSAGHGAGKPTSKLIDERSDVIAFLAGALGIEAGPVP